MVFVQRDSNSAICGVYEVAQYEAHEHDVPEAKRVPIAVEELPDDDAEVVAFREKIVPRLQ